MKEEIGEMIHDLIVLLMTVLGVFAFFIVAAMLWGVGFACIISFHEMRGDKEKVKKLKYLMRAPIRKLDRMNLALKRANTRGALLYRDPVQALREIFSRFRR